MSNALQCYVLAKRNLTRVIQELDKSTEIGWAWVNIEMEGRGRHLNTWGPFWQELELNRLSTHVISVKRSHRIYDPSTAARLVEEAYRMQEWVELIQNEWNNHDIAQRLQLNATWCAQVHLLCWICRYHKKSEAFVTAVSMSCRATIDEMLAPHKEAVQLTQAAKENILNLAEEGMYLFNAIWNGEIHTKTKPPAHPRMGPAHPPPQGSRCAVCNRVRISTFLIKVICRHLSKCDRSFLSKITAFIRKHMQPSHFDAIQETFMLQLGAIPSSHQKKKRQKSVRMSSHSSMHHYEQTVWAENVRDSSPSSSSSDSSSASSSSSDSSSASSWSDSSSASSSSVFASVSASAVSSAPELDSSTLAAFASASPENTERLNLALESLLAEIQIQPEQSAIRIQPEQQQQQQLIMQSDEAPPIPDLPQMAASLDGAHVLQEESNHIAFADLPFPAVEDHPVIDSSMNPYLQYPQIPNQCDPQTVPLYLMQPNYSNPYVQQPQLQPQPQPPTAPVDLAPPRHTIRLISNTTIPRSTDHYKRKSVRFTEEEKEHRSYQEEDGDERKSYRAEDQPGRRRRRVPLAPRSDKKRKISHESDRGSPVQEEEEGSPIHDAYDPEAVPFSAMLNVDASLLK
jgi:hypothetical protein